MLAQCALIAFIATTQPEQAKVFYGEALGLRLMEDTPFAWYLMLMAPCYASKRCRRLPQLGTRCLAGSSGIFMKWWSSC